MQRARGANRQKQTTPQTQRQKRPRFRASPPPPPPPARTSSRKKNRRPRREQEKRAMRRACFEKLKGTRGGIFPTLYVSTLLLFLFSNASFAYLLGEGCLSIMAARAPRACRGEALRQGCAALPALLTAGHHSPSPTREKCENGFGGTHLLLTRRSKLRGLANGI